MLCKEIIEIIERTYPKQAAMEWDNVGLLVGRTDKEVNKVLVALDLTDEASEVLLVVVLNAKNEINAIHKVFSGSLTSSSARLAT